MSQNRRVTVGSVHVALSKIDFVGSGGEGDVYAKNGVAYKLYHDPAKMIPDGKLRELGKIADQNVITPRDRIYNQNRQSVLGYTMRFLPDPLVLVQLFSNRFRTEKGITHQHLLDLAQQHRERTAAVHAAGCLVVDGNENNVLVSSNWRDLFLIDADSFQTPTYPATAINDTIRDRETRVGEFTRGSDWFSHAVLMAWLLRGIHPFRGTLDGFASGDLDARMIARKTIWSPGVRVPKAALPAGAVPPVYSDWLLSVFHEGVRCEPPAKIDSLSAPIGTFIRPKQVLSSATLKIAKIAEFDSAVKAAVPTSRDLVIITESSSYYGADKNWPDRETAIRPSFNAVIGHPSSGAIYVVVEDIRGQSCSLVDPWTNNTIRIPGAIKDMVVYQDCGYTRSGDLLSSVSIETLGPRDICRVRGLGPIMPNATHMFPGVVLQNMMGRWFAKVFPKPGLSRDYKLPDLDTGRIVSAKCSRGVLVVVAYLNGQYDRIRYILGDSDTPRAHIVHDVTVLEPNFTVLENGVCLLLHGEEELHMFRVSSPESVEILHDPALTTDSNLVSRGNSVLFTNQNEIWSLTKK